MKALFTFIITAFITPITMGQNVGIGTTMPTGKLHVVVPSSETTDGIKSETFLIGSRAIVGIGYNGGYGGYFKSSPTGIGIANALFASSRNGHNAIYTDSGNVLINRGNLRLMRGDIRVDTGDIAVGIDNAEAKVHVLSKELSATAIMGQALFFGGRAIAGVGAGGATGGYFKASPPFVGTANAIFATSRNGNAIYTDSGNVVVSLGNVLLQNGNLGIGVANPSAKLEVDGQIKITGGNPGADKVLTSDANGLASWRTISTGGFELPYNGAATTSTPLITLVNNGAGAGISVTAIGGNPALSGTNTNGIGVQGSANGQGIGVYGSTTNGAGGLFVTTGFGPALQTVGKTVIGVTGAAQGKYLQSIDDAGTAIWADAPAGGSGWSLNGNSGITANHFIGTTSNADVIFKHNNIEGLRIKAGGALLATGSENMGITPASGAGTRLMWIPAKGAFRAGNVSNGVTTNYWNDANIGLFSWAGGSDNIVQGAGSFSMGSRNAETTIGGHFGNALFGTNNTITNSSANIVSGQGNSVIDGFNTASFGTNHIVKNISSFATGNSQTVSGQYATAMGNTNIASGYGSIAIGDHNTSSGSVAVAIGNQCVANANGSFAMGNFTSTNSKAGAWCMGDFFAGSSTLMAAAENTMNARFKNGFNFFTNSTNTVGAFLGPGQSSWDAISDSSKKENLIPVDGEEFLQKIAGFNLTSWNYKGQSSKTQRHYGPMAQDFHAAFGKDSHGSIGCDTTINTGDFAGVSFIAIQALEKRTSVLATQASLLQKENTELKNANQLLQTELAVIKAQLTNQDAAIAKKLAQLEKLVLLQTSSSNTANR